MGERKEITPNQKAFRRGLVIGALIGLLSGSIVEDQTGVVSSVGQAVNHAWYDVRATASEEVGKLSRTINPGPRR